MFLDQRQLEFLVITALNSASYGLLLFMLSAGLTLIFSMMGVLNFAHASFYMLGAYFAYAISLKIGFWPALVLAPLAVGTIGGLVERYALRAIHAHGHVHELLLTFGLAYLVAEAVQLTWGRSPVPYRVPNELGGALFTVFSTTFPIYRAFMMLVAILMLASIGALLRFTRVGLVLQAALTHPAMAEALGHDVPRVFTLVFGCGSALAGLAGVIGGNAFSTEPAMAQSVGALVFVVIVVGGLGSIGGALVASLVIATVQTFAVASDHSLATLLARQGFALDPSMPGYAALSLSVSAVAPILPYVLMIVVLVFRPSGLMGRRGV